MEINKKLIIKITYAKTLYQITRQSNHCMIEFKIENEDNKMFYLDAYDDINDNIKMKVLDYPQLYKYDLNLKDVDKSFINQILKILKKNKDSVYSD